MTNDNTVVTQPAAYFIGIDVGTGSARAGVFDGQGRLVGSDKGAISTHYENGGIVEQSSAEIWGVVCTAVRGAVTASSVDPAQIKGIGFDATCSLVVLGKDGTPLPVGAPERADHDIVVWMDHRAVAQAARINDTKHSVLDYVGGRISPEMQTPKLLWLKENRPAIFESAWQFFDLTDFLTWRATGSLARSNCTLTCKWTYLGHEKRWDESYFRTISLGVLADEGFSRIGNEVVDPGTAVGAGLTKDSAQDLGLLPGTAVAAGLIDAHAGGIGSVGPKGGGGPEANLAYVFGTSSCTMTTTREPVFVPGVWGPYYSAMVPGTWLNEGGQSAAGAAIAQLLDFHPHTPTATETARQAGLSLPDWLADQATSRVAHASDAASLAGGVHVVPEFLGNRAPYANPETRAVIAGLGMERDLESLIALYIAGLCGIGYGLRQIIETQEKAGAKVERIVISGGAGRSDLVRQIMADSIDLEVAAPASEEPVMLGSAMIATVAAGFYADIPAAMLKMSNFGAIYLPADDTRLLHLDRFDVFKKFQTIARTAGSKTTIVDPESKSVLAAS